MAALSPVTSVEALLRGIEKSGLLAAEKVADIRQAAEKATDPKAFARELIKDGAITRWQAEQLLNGYYRLVIGKYKLLDQVGATPTGRLYLAEHAQMGRRHMLKVLAKRLASNPEAVKQFLVAAQNACGLDHRNISHVYDVNHDVERKSHYVVMEHLEGKTLEQLIEQGGPVKLPQALDFIMQAAEGLAHAHQNGVVHGDLKPANLLCDSAGTIKILEIGQAGTGAIPESESPDESVEMAALAAVIFQAPELRGDGDVADVSCDVYSLGSVLCFLLTGKAASDAAKAAALLAATPDISPEGVEMCRRFMADKPADRPVSMVKAIEQLAEFARGVAVAPAPLLSASPPSASPPPPPPRAVEKSEPAGEKSAAPPPRSKTKKPPVAKSLSGDDPPPIVISDEPQVVVEPGPIEPFVLKTRGRIGKKPLAAESPATAGSAPAATVKSPARLSTTFTPLVLAAAIGGGGMLVLALMVALVCLFALRGDTPQVAQNGAATVTNKDASKPAAESNPAPPSEANPEVNPVSVTPELAAAVTDGKPETPTSALPAAAAALPPATKESPPTAKESPPEATLESTVEPKPAPAEEPKPAAPAPAKPLKPAAARRAKAAETKPKLFEGLALAVDLPELPEGPTQPAKDAAAPLTIGPCQVEENSPLVIALHGGESAIRATRHKFELQPKAGDNRQWEIALSGGGSPSPVAVATLSINDNQLTFQWTAEGIKQAATTRQLINCALELSVEKARHVVALRLPISGDPLSIDIEKSGASAKWNIGDLPAAKQTFVEVTKVEGFKKVRQEPKEPVNAGTPITVWAGPTEKSAPLGLKLAPTAAARGITVALQPQVKLEGWTEARFTRKKELTALQQKAGQELPIVQNNLAAAKRDRVSPIPAKAAIEGPMLEQRRNALTTQLSTLTAMLEQIVFVTDFMDTLQAAAKIHFRVYHQAGPVQVDLLITDVGGEPSEKK